MKRCPLAIVALASAGCWSTTTGSTADPGVQRWLADNDASEMIAETTDRGPEQPGVVVQAPSPTEISFRTKSGAVVPIGQVRRLTVVSHGRGALEGAGIGVVTGALLGGLYGMSRGLSSYERSMDCTIICNNSDAAEWGALMFGVLGLISGTLVGALAGHRDVLDLR
jgi:hypothetical protein